MAENAITEDEFSGIPDMPSDDSIRAELFRTGGIENWHPHGGPESEPVDFASLPPKAAERVINARMATGPGKNGTAWQHAVWDQWRRVAELEREHKRIAEQLDEVRSYDPESGKPIPMIGSPDKRKALGFRLAEIAEEQARIEGEPGRRKLEKKMAEAVVAEKRRIKQAYMVAEAKRRAASSSMEAEIERMAEGFRKTQPDN